MYIQSQLDYIEGLEKVEVPVEADKKDLDEYGLAVLGQQTGKLNWVVQGSRSEICCRVAGLSMYNEVDVVHTLRYCPLNKDGTYNRGASLADLKKLRNATGNYRKVTRKKVMMCRPLPAYVTGYVEDPILSRIWWLESELNEL